MTSVLADIRYACRSLIAQPFWTLAAVACLAIGTGANTASLSVVNALVFRPLPFPESEQIAIVILREANPPRLGPFSLDEYRAIASDATLFSELSARTFLPVSVTAGEPARMVQSELVSGNYFAMLRISPLIGRFFDADSTLPEAVLSERLFRQRFGGDPSILGRRIRINGREAVVSGVAPSGFGGATQMIRADMWLPLSLFRALNPSANATTAPLFGVLGRLATGATREQARLQLDSLVARMEGRHLTTQVDAPDGLGFGAAIRPVVLGGSALVFGLIGLVVAVAIANVAGLMLVRGAGRRPEIGLKLALGATPARIARQIMAESLVLGLSGSALGGLLCFALMTAAPSLSSDLPDYLSYAVDFAPDWRVFMGAAVTAIAVSVLFGLAPAREAARTDFMEALKHSGTGRRTPASIRKLGALVVGQMAVSTMLLVGCTLLAQTYIGVRNTDSGMDMRNGLTVSLDLNQAHYDELQGYRFYGNLLDRVSSLPGVESACLTREAPLFLGTPENVVVGESRADRKVVTPGYFATMRIPLLQGRDFSASDRTPVAVVNETMAAQFWPGKSPIGQIFRIEESGVEVIGVAKDTKYRSLTEPARAVFYRPLHQQFSPHMTLILRSSQAPALSDAVRREIQSENPDLAAINIRTLEDLLRIEIAPRKRAAIILSSVCGLGLLLSCVGLYGVVAFGVRERVREFGLRVALGARPHDMRRLVLGAGFRLTVMGFLIGLLGSLGLTRILRLVLADVASLDFATLGIVGFVLASVALLASYLPARWATRVDPAIALRAE
jgi:predicted permease